MREEDTHSPARDTLDWVEILQSIGIGADVITFESLAKFHDDLWTDLEMELDDITGSGD